MDMPKRRVLPSEIERAEELCKLLAELSEKGQDDALVTILEQHMGGEKAS